MLSIPSIAQRQNDHWSFSTGCCVCHFFLRFRRLYDSRRGSGMKRNWLSLSKAFHRDLQRPVYALVRVALLCPGLPLIELFCVLGSPQPRFVSPRKTDELRGNGSRYPPLLPIAFSLQGLPPRPFYVRLQCPPPSDVLSHTIQGRQGRHGCRPLHRTPSRRHRTSDRGRYRAVQRGALHRISRLHRRHEQSRAEQRQLSTGSPGHSRPLRTRASSTGSAEPTLFLQDM